MRLLTLVRHAKSSWEYPELSDFERPLNERGRRDAPLMAERLRRSPPRPDRLVSSPALRAITTAHIFADALSIPRDDIVLQPRIYEASAATLLRIVRGLDDGDRHVMLFGHNPGFSELAHLLADCTFDELPTCAVARFELDVKTWQDVGEDCGQLARYGCPKMLQPD
jgi:phosphohistidine phosphatase